MFRKKLVYLFLLAMPFAAFAQDDIPVTPKTRPPYSLSDHLVYGGNLGLSFGTVTNISIAPMVGYKVTDRFIPGIGFTYDYLKINDPYYGSQSINIYGGSLWARYYILYNIFLHGEYEALNGEWDPFFRPDYRYYLNSFLLGGGYTQHFGALSSYLLVLYNITYDQDSPYPSPLIIRAGFGVGF